MKQVSVKFKPSKHSAHNVTKSIQEIMKLLDTYLCLHGLTCMAKFKWTCKNFVLFCVSKLFIVINVINHIFFLFIRCLALLKSSHSGRDYIIFVTISLMEFFLMLLFFSKRSELKDLIRFMVKIYPITKSHSILKIKKVIILMLLLNDIFILLISFSYIGDKISEQNFEYLKELKISPHFFSILHACIFMDMWGYITPYIPIYFCCFCYVFRKIILELNEKFSKQALVKFDLIDEMYKKVLLLNTNINKTFHTMVFTTILIISGRLLYHTYSIVFSRSFMGSVNLVYRFANIVFSLTRFLIICVFAASVSAAANEFKNSVHDVPMKMNERWKYLRVAMKMNENFIGFKLLDSVKVDKSLFIALLGSLMSYGIIIATFNVNIM